MDLRKNRLWDTVFLMTVGVLLAWSVVAAILNTTVFQDAHLQNLIRVFVIIGVVRLLFSHKLLQWGSAVCLIFGFGFLVYGFLSYPEEPGLSQDVALFVRETVLYVGGYLEYRLLFEQIIVWSISIAVGLSVVVWTYVFPLFFVLFVVSSGLFAVVLASPFFNFHLAFYVFIFCVLAYLIRHLSQKIAAGTSREAPLAASEEGRGRRGAAPVLSTVGLAVFCMLFASFLPMPQGGVPSVTSNPFQAINDAIYSATRPAYFSLRHIGFSEGGGRLGGDIVPDDRVFLYVRTDRREPFYLAGAMMDIYTGNSWENRSMETVLFDSADMEQHLAFFERVSSNTVILLLQHPLYGITVDAEHGFTLQTMDIFTTSSMYSVFSTDLVQDVFARDLDVTFLRDQRGRFSALDRMPRNTSYTLVHRRPYAPTPVWNLPLFYRGILQDVSQLLEDLYPNTLFFQYQEMNICYVELLNDYLIPRAAWIHETYTVLPEDFPARVGDLARTITAEAESDFERAMLLERHLATQYRYTLTPGPSPPGRDFVDHFLFDLQAGYCVHFASAFVTMARSIGLPTRYVEGFLVSGRPEESHGYISVRNNMGHAWAEVYLEGYGWLLFEPTPGFSMPGLNESEANDPDSPIFDWQPPHVEAGRFPDVNFPPGGDQVLPPGSGTGQNITQAQPDSGPQREGRLWPIFALLPLLFLAGLGLRILWLSVRRGQIDQLEHDEAVLSYFGVLLRYMKCFGLTIKEAETAAQFMARAGGPPQVASIFAKARYSEHAITLEERNLVADAVNQMDTELRNSVGRIRYWFYKFILGRV